MTKALAVMFVCLACAGVDARAKDRYSSCLPAGASLDSTILVDASAANKQTPKSGVTVRDKLRQLNARCKRGKLVDGHGRQIQFYTLIGCWGNPPEDYLDQLNRQDAEVARLKKQYTLIQIPCKQSRNPRDIY